MTKIKSILITGGAGFIGINTADHFLKKGIKVRIFDNFSKFGCESNIEWLKNNNKGKENNVEVIKGDIRDYDQISPLVDDVDVIFHFAAQVAVTTSVVNPKEDFDINAMGTLNLLESIRKSKNDPILLYSSTNKVYGKMDNVEVIGKGKRYEYKDIPKGAHESTPLDFHSPYGCSKGCADQYIRDYSRIYGLRSIVFRQSCIYGQRQFGMEDQGWVAWFIIASLLGKKITIYGDGKQIRDLLYITDLVEAFNLATKNIEKTKGKIYNIGGGAKNTLSLLELVDLLEGLLGKKIEYSYGDWRAGDQKVFVSNISKAEKDFGWVPRVDVKEGVKRLFDWVNRNRQDFAKL